MRIIPVCYDCGTRLAKLVAECNCEGLRISEVPSIPMGRSLKTIMDTLNDAIFAGRDLSRTCRFLLSPFQDCFCMNITAHKISKIIAFCAGEFESCPVYRSKTRQVEFVDD